MPSPNLIALSNDEVAALPKIPEEVTVTFSIDDALDLVNILADRSAQEGWSNRVVAELVSATGLSMEQTRGLILSPQDAA